MADVFTVLYFSVLQLLALRDAEPSDVLLADGFSCRTQIEQCDSGGRRAVHLAELLMGIDGGRADPGWRHTQIRAAASG
jgi:hypothetical protein